MAENARIRTLRHALTLVGGHKRLANILGANEQQLERWLDGEVEVPPHAFFAALDVVSKGDFGQCSCPDGSFISSRHG